MGNTIPDIEFDADTHTYAVGGVLVPSVTEILRLSKLCDPRFYKGGSAQHGSEVHKMLEEWDRDKIAPNIWDDLTGYLDSWRRFLSEWPCRIVAVEKMVCQSLGGARGSLGKPLYAGRVDRIIERIEHDTEPERWIIDIKTGSPARWHRVQTALYSMAETSVICRACVYLNGRGGYRFVEHTNQCDYAAARAAVTLAAWTKNK